MCTRNRKRNRSGNRPIRMQTQVGNRVTANTYVYIREWEEGGSKKG